MPGAPRDVHMRKWIKTGLTLIALLLVGAIIASFVSYQLAKGRPAWYRPHSLSIQERAEAARRADDKFLALVGRAADAQAAKRRSPNDPGPGASSDPMTVSFTDDELNAFFYKWIQFNHWDQKMGRYLKDPQIILQDGDLILAGQVTADGLMEQTILSIRFKPALDSAGQLMMQIEGISAGRLPLPDAIWESQRAKLEAMVQQKLPSLRRQARISDTGTANATAVAMLMGESLLNVLDGQPTAPLVFLPVGQDQGYPMRLTGLRIDKGTITLSAVPLTTAQRGALRERLGP